MPSIESSLFSRSLLLRIRYSTASSHTWGCRDIQSPRHVPIYPCSVWRREGSLGWQHWSRLHLWLYSLRRHRRVSSHSRTTSSRRILRLMFCLLAMVTIVRCRLPASVVTTASRRWVCRRSRHFRRRCRLTASNKCRRQATSDTSACRLPRRSR